MKPNPLTQVYDLIAPAIYQIPTDSDERARLVNDAIEGLTILRGLSEKIDAVSPDECWNSFEPE